MGLCNPSMRWRGEPGGCKRQGARGTGTVKEMLIPNAAMQIGLSDACPSDQADGKRCLSLILKGFCVQVQSGNSTSNKFTRRSNEEYFSYSTRIFYVVISILVQALNIILAQEAVAYEAKIKLKESI